MLIRAPAGGVSCQSQGEDVSFTYIAHHDSIQQSLVFRPLLSSSSSPCLSQGVEGVPIPHGPEDALHDQLAGSAAAGGDSAGGAVVPGGLDVRRVPDPRAESGPDLHRPHPRGAAVQHVSAGPMGLHDVCR